MQPANENTMVPIMAMFLNADKRQVPAWPLNDS